MTLSSRYTLAPGRIPDLLSKIRDGQAPEQLTQQLLKDWGFTSSTDRAIIPILKELGFLSPDGKPTSRYHDYRDHSRSTAVMADALRDAYGDLFLIKEHPTDADKKTIKGKFKSFHNVSDNTAQNMTGTFYAFLALSDLNAAPSEGSKADEDDGQAESEGPPATVNGGAAEVRPERLAPPGLHYNIQIHLPASKDVEVYNAIFKSLKEHLLEG